MRKIRRNKQKIHEEINEGHLWLKECQETYPLDELELEEIAFIEALKNYGKNKKKIVYLK